MSQRPALLDEILESAKRQRSLGKQLVAIFDLDSTLFDVSPRISEIFRRFAKEEEMKRLYPRECEILARITPHVSDFGVKRTLERIQLRPPDEEFVKTIVDYWKKQFFGNHFLKYDVPYPGACAFVSDLFQAGAQIQYLTGRDRPRMYEGTVESLKKWGFPLEEGHANLILKPSTAEIDSEFKKDFFMKMERKSEEVWFFENEPTNIELVLANTPHIKVVFVETVHSGKTPPPGARVPKISGFEM